MVFHHILQFIYKFLDYVFVPEGIIASYRFSKRVYNNVLYVHVSIYNPLYSSILCSDLTSILTDATEIIQSVNSLFLSVGLYWFYVIQNHNIDIIFMIGIKTNYFLKLAWLLNPCFICVILYARWEIMETHEFQESYYIESISMPCDLVLLYILLCIYFFIIVVGLIAQVVKFYKRGELHLLINATKIWGPKDKILFRSRNMFVPEIMTREFLYRQVRIRGYYKKRKTYTTEVKKVPSVESLGERLSWTVVVSNYYVHRFI